MNFDMRFSLLRWLFDLLLLLACVHVSAQPLAELRFDIVGLRLAVEPQQLTVPKDIPTFVRAKLGVPGESDANVETAIAELADGAVVVAELRGPEIARTIISALPGEPLYLPPFRVAGDYFLDDIRLVKDGETLLLGTPSAVPIAVIDEVLLSSVTTRELSLQEIQARGIVVDERSFRTLEFQAAFVIDGQDVQIDFPVIVPRAQSTASGGGTAQPDLAAAIQASLASAQQTQIELPAGLGRPGLNFHLAGAEFVRVDPLGEPERPFALPPIPAVLLIPGNIGYLNQFSSALVMVQNGAPGGSGLTVEEVRAAARLPLGADRVPGDHEGPNPDPGDDPLRFAVTAAGIQSEVAVRQPGPDGERGTADDLDYLRPGESGEGELLIEGLREGTHVFDVDLEAVLVGLPSGPERIIGRVLGTVQVRNATFSLTLGQPDTVAAQETFELFATLTNTSDRTVNLASVTLDGRAISGAALIDDQGQPLDEQTVVFDSLAAGESALASFRLRAEATGRVTFSQITTEPGVTANFTLRAAVGERGEPVSPSTLVLPSQTDRAPADLVRASQRVLGQAYSAATAPRLPAGVRYIPRGTVLQRGRELAEISLLPDFGLPLTRALHELALDWLGNGDPDPGFEQLLRTTEAGDQWTDALGAALAADLGPVTVLDIQRDLAATVAYRAPHISAAIGDGAATAPARLRLGDPFGQTFERGLADAPRAERRLPFAQSLLLDDSGDARAELGFVGHLLTDRYTVEVLGTGAGQTDLGLVVPAADGELLHAVFTGLETRPGSRFLLTVDLQSPADLVLQVDLDDDGRFEATRVPAGVESIPEAAPEVLAARSLTDLSESFRVNLGAAHFGQLVDLLLNKTVAAASAEDASRYRVADNEVLDAVLQPTGRVVTLLLRKPIGSLIPRRLQVAGIEDLRGAASPAQDLAIDGLLDDGARLIGQVTRADGQGVGGALVRLSAYLSATRPPAEQTISEFFADADGYYDVDFVRRTDSPYFRVTAFDPATGEQASVQSRVRFVGETEIVNPVFFGRGRVIGQVLMPDGVTPARLTAVNLFPDFYRTGEPGRGTYSDDQGVFAFEDVPVGNFRLTAEAVALTLVNGERKPIATGPYASASGTVRASGETVELRLVTTLDPAPRTGGVRGRVFLADGTPAAGFPVYLGGLDRTGRLISATAQTTTDADGSFTFSDLRPQTTSAIAVDPILQTAASSAVTVRGDQVTGVNLTFGATGAVSGFVRYDNGDPVPGALVSGGFELVEAGDDGAFRIATLPTGDRTIAAGDPATQKTGSRKVTVFPGQETLGVDLRLRPAADIAGTVRDGLGQPVAGALVRIPVPGAGYFKAVSDADGRYVFPNHALGDILISASGMDDEAPLSRDEVAERLTSDLADAEESRSRNAIRAAFKQALEVYVGTSELLRTDVEVVPGGFGHTRVTSARDGITAQADIDYIPVGRVAGTTIDGNGLPTRATMEARGLTLDKFGQPVFGRLGRFDSDAVTGAFDAGFLPYGNYLVKAARPFSPGSISATGVLGPANPADDDLVLQFPPAQETNGVLTGRVFEVDGVTPVGEGVDVQIDFGESPLTPQTDADGAFDAQLPLPPRAYTLTAIRQATGDTGRSKASVRPGETAFVPIRLLGETSVRVRVLRPDGRLVPGAAVTIAGNGFPDDGADGTTDADGVLAVASLLEGSYRVAAVEGDQLIGRTAFEITQADVLDGREVEIDVRLRGYGSISGIFLDADGIPVTDAQVSLRVAGVSVVTYLGPMAAVTTTDALGEFAFERVPVGDFSILAVDPTSLRAGDASGNLQAQGDSVDLTIRARAIGRVEGVVLSQDGLAAIEGASVYIRPSRLPDGLVQLPRVTAGVDGRFVIDGVPEGPFTIDAVDPLTGFRGSVAGDVTGENETTEVEVRIEGFGKVQGQVFRAGGLEVADNVDVTINAPPRGRTTAVDGEGRFSFAQLPLSVYELRAVSRATGEALNGAIHDDVRLVQHGQVEDVALALNGLGTVEVTVVDGNSDPAGATLVEVAAGGPIGGILTSATAADTGRVTVPGVAVGEFTVRAESPSLRVAGAVTDEILAAGDVVAVTVMLGEAGSIRGRLLLPDGQTPVPDAVVTLRYPAMVGSGLAQVQTDAVTGAFAFANIPVGDFRIEVFEPLSRGRLSLDGTLASQDQVADLGDLLLDLEAPFVTGTDPIDGAAGVPTDADLLLTFNEPLLPASVSFDNSGSPFARQGAVSLVDADGNKLPGRHRPGGRWSHPAHRSARRSRRRDAASDHRAGRRRRSARCRGGPAARRAAERLLHHRRRDPAPGRVAVARPVGGHRDRGRRR
jgi:hypothetical protein